MMRIFKIIILAICTVCIGSCDFSQQQANNKDNSEKVLYMYTSLDTNEAKIYIRAFEQDTGIKVRWVRMSSGEVLVRVRSEHENPQVAVWFGGPSPEFIIAKNDGLLAPHRPQADFEFVSGNHDPEFHWAGFYFGALGFACNTEILQRKKLDIPTSWQDLLKPEFKNEIGIAYAYTSGTSYTILATLVQLMGEDKAFDYIAALDKHIHHYNKSGSACVTQVGFGEIGIGIAFYHDIIKKGPSKGFPVKLSFPIEGTGYEIGAVALVKGGPNQKYGKQFIDWIFSLKAQNMLKQWYRTPLHPQAEIAKQGFSADQVKLIKFDANWAGKNKRRLIEKWRETTAQ